jgi:predicted metal-dependent phosphoesterase TrpH
VIDLHLHTSCSDGRDTPAELAARCAAAGIRVFAVTDHDTTAAWPEAARAAAACGLAFVRGVEITAVLDGIDVHLLGYFPSAAPPLLDDFLQAQREHRVRRAYLIVDRLKELGKPVRMEAVLLEAERHRRRAIGRPQIADALVAAGHVGTRDEAFDRYLGHGRAAFVPRTGASPEEVIALIVGAGGLASLAHPGLTNRDDRVPSMIAAGLGALEVFHPDHDAAATLKYRDMAARAGLLVTGGSDFHGEHAGHHGGMLGRITVPEDQYRRFEKRLRRP